jgi:hypothetical protein
MIYLRFAPAEYRAVPAWPPASTLSVVEWHRAMRPEYGLHAVPRRRIE